MSQQRAAAAIAPREDISPAQINAKIERLRPAANRRPSETDQSRAPEPTRVESGAQDSVLNDILSMMRDMQDRMNRAEAVEFDRCQSPSRNPRHTGPHRPARIRDLRLL